MSCYQLLPCYYPELLPVVTSTRCYQSNLFSLNVRFPEYTSVCMSCKQNIWNHEHATEPYFYLNIFIVPWHVCEGYPWVQSGSSDFVARSCQCAARGCMSAWMKGCDGFMKEWVDAMDGRMDGSMDIMDALFFIMNRWMSWMDEYVNGCLDDNVFFRYWYLQNICLSLSFVFSVIIFIIFIFIFIMF